MDRIVTGLLQERSERWRKSVVDQELHSPAARGRARSRTASAAKSSASADVVSFEVWVQREDVLCCLSFSHQGNDSRDWNPKTAKTWNAPHLAGIGRNPLEFHVDSVAGRRDLWKESARRQCSSSNDSGPDSPPGRVRFIRRLAGPI